MSFNRRSTALVGDLLKRQIFQMWGKGFNVARSSYQQSFLTNNQRSSFARYLNTAGGGISETAPFDRFVKLKQRTRAAKVSCLVSRRLQPNGGSKEASSRKSEPLAYDYFHREIAHRLVDRLDDINIRENGEGGFPLALEIGAGSGFVHEAISDGCADYDDLGDTTELSIDTDVEYTGRGGVRKLVQLDSCSAMLYRDDSNDERSSPNIICDTYKLVAEEEGPFPFPDETFDLVISSMAFHWINDLPRLLTEIKRVLKPDGCLLFALPGGNTLPELRSSLVLAELERTGGVSTHLGPYVDLSNVGSLLTGTGFKLPTIDVDDVQIGYPNMMVLMEHLTRMGEGNACLNRKDRIGLGTFLSAACLYEELYQLEDDHEDSGIVASAQIIYGIAWKEHEAQPKPLERGTATHKMTDIAVTQTRVEQT